MKHVFLWLLNSLRASQLSGTGLAHLREAACAYGPKWGNSVLSGRITADSLSQEGFLRINVHLCLLRIKGVPPQILNICEFVLVVLKVCCLHGDRCQVCRHPGLWEPRGGQDIGGFAGCLEPGGMRSVVRAMVGPGP